MRSASKTVRTARAAAWMLLVAAVSAHAQQPSSPPSRVAIPTAPRTLPPDVAPNVLWQAATQAAQMIDQSQMAALWQQASAAARSKVSADTFAKGVVASRAGLGTLTQRRWAALNLQSTPGSAALPAGEYFDCEFISSFSSGRTLRELVSFRLDEDNVWRFAGYALQRR